MRNILLHELGTKHDQKIIMIHGTGMSWDMFMPCAQILSEEYHVILVSVPGHDPNTTEEFSTIEQIAGEIEKALINRGYKDVDMLYGLSMGGGIALRILADQCISFKHAVIDAGITPYELPWLFTRIILIKDFLMTEWGKHSKKALSFAFPAEDYSPEAINRMFYVLQHMSAKTIWHVYDSTDNYSMPEVFPQMNTAIEYWYGEKEEKERRLDIRYVKKHISKVRFRKLPGMKHGQYVMTQTEGFVSDIRKRLGEEDEPENNNFCNKGRL